LINESDVDNIANERPVLKLNKRQKSQPKTKKTENNCFMRELKFFLSFFGSK
jgi:hypothetical protein